MVAHVKIVHLSLCGVLYGSIFILVLFLFLLCLCTALLICINYYLCGCIFKALLWQKVFNFWHMASEIFTLNFAIVCVCPIFCFVFVFLFILSTLIHVGQRTAIISVGINAGDFGFAFASNSFGVRDRTHTYTYDLHFFTYFPSFLF